jgi:sigma-B regulation protein RsbU (phosphoserine phosphatase)
MTVESNIARRLQAMVPQPPAELQQFVGLDIVGYMRPADEVGGDYYDGLSCRDGQVCVGSATLPGMAWKAGF